jgi:hypothetical protein
VQVAPIAVLQEVDTRVAFTYKNAESPQKKKKKEVNFMAAVTI